MFATSDLTLKHATFLVVLFSPIVIIIWIQLLCKKVVQYVFITIPIKGLWRYKENCHNSSIYKVLVYTNLPLILMHAFSRFHMLLSRTATNSQFSLQRRNVQVISFSFINVMLYVNRTSNKIRNRHFESDDKQNIPSFMNSSYPHF